MPDDVIAISGEAGLSPLVLDSPHSGVEYPADFSHDVALSSLRQAEDTYVEKLFAFAPEIGAPLLQARFPRSYIDVNRSQAEIDAQLLEATWPEPLSFSEKVRRGKGLIWRTLDNGQPIYARPLTHQEIRYRIEHYWLPYHEALRQLLDDTYRTLGIVMHLNCHAMPADTVRKDPRATPRSPDIVLGDRQGESCNSEITHFVADTFSTLGYSCALNDPYQGEELIRAYAAPSRRRHSLEIEINRGLYMDEATLELTSGFARLQQDLRNVLMQLKEFLKVTYR